ncbi:DMT family transporter [Chryseosolibacter indicus]|uniref:DMT family transporter n=1 Tax=Chryseosolibacter indicus TaxID=2782351 RepID=A0ABS5VRN0_9BACT|nr:multidrug resistance efflux transporter family protein [Chryseosolibacter indicus]MBT1704098.1 DMT family transporter [Chryseosolibacter indicus]
MPSVRKTAIVLGLLSSLFFAITFVVNRVMSLEGGSWVWSASLRFYWMLPLFLIIVAYRRNFKALIAEIKLDIKQWILWSTVGFGIFYASLTFGAAYGPSWLVASTWQFTIIAGIILSPLIHSSGERSNLLSSLLFSGVILLGIIIMQVSHAESFSLNSFLLGILPVLIAAFAYPLGNRMMMQLTRGRIDVYQRILGMLICSMPFWFLLSSYELFVAHTTPEKSQYTQTFLVAISSGVIATALFFFATDKVSTDEKALAAVEATQSAEVVFALAGEIWLLNSALPDIYAMIGMALVIIGMVLHSYKG